MNFKDIERQFNALYETNDYVKAEEIYNFLDENRKNGYSEM